MAVAGAGAGISELTAIAVVAELAPTRKRVSHTAHYYHWHTDRLSGEIRCVTGRHHSAFLSVCSLGSVDCLSLFLAICRYHPLMVHPNSSLTFIRSAYFVGFGLSLDGL